MREIELVDYENLSRRLEDIRKSFEDIYNLPINVDFEELSLDRLLPTEPFLEKDKLAMVFRRIIEEKYRVPIIAVKYSEVYGILDGHHRAYIWKKLDRSYIQGYVLKFYSDKSPVPKSFSFLEAMPIRDVGEINDPYLLGWSQILTLLKYYEMIYEAAFTMAEDYLSLDMLVPTQPMVDNTRLESMNEILVPIVCVAYRNRFYILDGHVRALAAKRDGHTSIHSIILLSKNEIEYGIVKTAEKMGLSNLNDIKVI